MKIRKNKKAWLRILEAFIAIILITSVLIVLYARVIEKPGRAEEIYNLQEAILDEIADSLELRRDVLSGQTGDIVNFIRERVPSGFSFAVKICEVGVICELGEYKKQVYSSERVISSTLEQYLPKKLKIFMWEE